VKALDPLRQRVDGNVRGPRVERVLVVAGLPVEDTLQLLFPRRARRRCGRRAGGARRGASR
jgi:hypothetical protein